MNESMKKIITVIFIVLLVLAGCTDKGTNEIRIGAILPLTGNLSVVGFGTNAGLNIAFDSIKKIYPNKEIKLYVEDFASVSKNISSCASKLINVNKVNALITNTTYAAEIVSPLAEKENIFHFVLSPDVDVLNISQINYRIYYNYKKEAESVREIITKLKAKKISILALDNPAFRNMINKNIIPYFSNSDINFEIEYYDVKESDFSNYILKIKSRNPDLIYVCPQIFHVESITKQLAQYGFISSNMCTIIGSFSFNWAPLDYLKTLDGYYLLMPGSAMLSNRDIDDLYYDRYNKMPMFDVYYAFDNMMILTKLLVNNIDNFSEGFNKIGNYSGVSGEIRFVGSNETDLDMKVMKVSNGNIIEID